MYFNRYTENIDYVRRALNEREFAYCNPKDYSVTKEECIKYLEELELGQNRNIAWNNNRRKRAINIGLISCTLLFVLLCGLTTLLILKYAGDWTGLIAPFIWITGSPSIWIYCRLEEKYRLEEIFCSDFFPPVNYKIEKLLDDYIWKEKLLAEANKKNSEERMLIREKVEIQSHPYIKMVKETIQNELSHPLDPYVIGDIKFGMTIEEVYKTKVFSGLDIQNDTIDLGYREHIIASLYGLPCLTFISFEFEKDALTKVKMTSNSSVDAYMACCAKLNSIFGNPSNLFKDDCKSNVYLFPENEAIFSIGLKCIKVNLEKYERWRDLPTVVVEILHNTTNTNEKRNRIQYEYSTEWFGRLKTFIE